MKCVFNLQIQVDMCIGIGSRDIDVSFDLCPHPIKVTSSQVH